MLENSISFCQIPYSGALGSSTGLVMERGLMRAEISELIPELSTVKITPNEDNYRVGTRAFVATVFLMIFVAGEVKVHFTQEQAMKAQRGSSGIAVLFL